jgi:serine O-acetyltransferase
VTLRLLLKTVIGNKGFRATAAYRLKNYAYFTNKAVLLKFFLFINAIINGIDISHRAEIGLGLQMPHAQCIVIGDATIGDNITIYPGVTIGATWNKERQGRRYPTIGEGVKISTGAKIIGPVSIGENSVIGANAVVTHDIQQIVLQLEFRRR